jgi:single-strand DNA-binding protein
MIGINSVTIIGNIGTISEIHTTTNGARFVNLTIATTETYYSGNNEKKNNTQWHNVIIWNNMCEIHKLLNKGDLVYVEGRLNYRKKADGVLFTEIVAKNFRILNRKNYSKFEDLKETTSYNDDDEDFELFLGENE